MFGFSSRPKDTLQEQLARQIDVSLADRWDLNKTFTMQGEGAAGILTGTLNQVLRRLTAFIADLTQKSVDMATFAPLTNAISRKVLQSAESLSQGAEQIEDACRNLADGIGKSSESANQALEQSAAIIIEIAEAQELTDQALARMQMMGKDVAQLSTSITTLDQRSRSIGSIIESISDIADNTGLLSLNAFIEAARAGEHGAGFSVISREIRELSQETSRAAQEVKVSLLAISELIRETVAAVSSVKECVNEGLQVNRNATSALEKVNREHQRFHHHLESVISVVEDQEKSVAMVAGDISTITVLGKEGITDSKRLAELAEKVNSITEEQLLATGIFILPQYRKAEADVLAIATDPDICGLGIAMDQALERRMKPFPYLELVYVTDNLGRQVSSNVFRKEQKIIQDTSAKGKNWSKKAWFENVIKDEKTFISEIYRSDATNSFCLTISVPLHRQAKIIGVLGADISFADLLHI